MVLPLLPLPLPLFPFIGWLRSVGSMKLQVAFAEYRLFNRAVLQKWPIIWSMLLTEATPYDISLISTTHSSSHTPLRHTSLRLFPLRTLLFASFPPPTPLRFFHCSSRAAASQLWDDKSQHTATHTAAHCPNLSPCYLLPQSLLPSSSEADGIRGSKLQVNFRKRAIHYRVVLRKICLKVSLLPCASCFDGMSRLLTIIGLFCRMSSLL